MKNTDYVLTKNRRLWIILGTVSLVLIIPLEFLILGSGLGAEKYLTAIIFLTLPVVFILYGKNGPNTIILVNHEGIQYVAKHKGKEVCSLAWSDILSFSTIGRSGEEEFVFEIASSTNMKEKEPYYGLLRDLGEAGKILHIDVSGAFNFRSGGAIRLARPVLDFYQGKLNDHRLEKWRENESKLS